MFRCCGRRKKPFEEGYPDIKVNNREANSRSGYSNNYIRTTKYTPLTFLPKNLFEQFRRTTNFYFLLIVVITFIPSISPLQPWTALLPLLFVLFVSAVKEGYEDYVRYKSDRRVNNARYTRILPGGGEEEIQSMDIQVGDLIAINDDEAFPADICLLWSSNEDAVSYVETSSLDGETNLKTLKVRPELSYLTREEIANWNQTVMQAEVPAPALYSFTGALRIEEQSISISAEQLLLRGASLRNTGVSIGVVVYVGPYTKLSLNAKQPPSKFSNSDKVLNKVVVALFIFQVILCVIGGLFGAAYQYTNAADNPFIPFDESPLAFGIKGFFSYFALLSFLIPMSLMVTLEVVKVVQSIFMEWDCELAMDPTDVAKTGMKAKTSNLNDELALIKYIFSDKTGTLTENIMRFRKCSVDGVRFEDAFDGEIGRRILDDYSNLSESRRAILQEFLVNLAVNHGATATSKGEGSGEEIIYTSPSPDEEALCQGAAINGAVYRDRRQDRLLIELFGRNTAFEVLNVFDFTSARARMSVIVRDPDGIIKMYSKGADSKMLPLLAEDHPQSSIDSVNSALDQFSQEGLRTLILGMKEISEEEYKAWSEEYHAASIAMNDRQSLIDQAVAKIECGFQLLGCSAIEDKLQKEVPETIHYLLQAGIRLWMITGDKQETAINIGNSCKLLNEEMEVVIINVKSSEACRRAIIEGLEKVKKNKESKGRAIGLVVNGGSLDWALDNHVDEFLDLALVSQSVIICRASPLQKAKVVKFIKEGEQAITLSIGDGANDVSMIQEAHVGVGIFGREGSQAARNADYAIREFRHLKRLMVIHGRYSLIRNSSLIQYSFYKNAAFFLPLFWYAFFSGFSGMTMYDDLLVTLFNIIFTSIPPFFIAIFDKDISETTILKFPQVYIPVQKNPYLNYTTLSFWLLSAIWHSFFVFIAALLAFDYGVVFSNGQTGGIYLFGNVVSIVLFFVISLKISIETLLWNVPVLIGIVGSLLLFLLLVLLESILPSLFPHQYGIAFHLLRMPSFYALVLLLNVLCLGPELFLRAWGRAFHPEDWEILQERQVKNRDWFEWRRGQQIERNVQEERAQTGGMEEYPRTRSSLRHTYKTDEEIGTGLPYGGPPGGTGPGGGRDSFRERSSFLGYASEADLRVSMSHERRYSVMRLREEEERE